MLCFPGIPSERVALAARCGTLRPPCARHLQLVAPAVPDDRCSKRVASDPLAHVAQSGLDQSAPSGLGSPSSPRHQPVMDRRPILVAIPHRVLPVLGSRRKMVGFLAIRCGRLDRTCGGDLCQPGLFVPANPGSRGIAALTSHARYRGELFHGRHHGTADLSDSVSVAVALSGHRLRRPCHSLGYSSTFHRGRTSVLVVRRSGSVSVMPLATTRHFAANQKLRKPGDEIHRARIQFTTVVGIEHCNEICIVIASSDKERHT